MKILVAPESLYLFVTNGEFYRWKMFHLEFMKENVTSYGNRN